MRDTALWNVHKSFEGGGVVHADESRGPQLGKSRAHTLVGECVASQQVESTVFATLFPILD